ncbi:Structural maintenance of chromosomes protein 6 [Actinomortierella wolfii]|nr:Structural maintenance of chromosomes protein 6 [Actinomortierella wolfii]
MAAYSLFNQRVDWDNQIIASFDLYADKHRGSSDVSEDFIMDFTIGSFWFKGLSSDIYDLAIVQGYAKYFPRYSHLPDKGKHQFMIDIIDPVLRGAFEVFGMPSCDIHISEGTSILESEESMDLKTADFVGYDSYGNQLVLVQCSTMYETDTKKLWADRRRLSRAMKDAFDSTIKKYAEKVQPHRWYSVFGIQVFGGRVTFLKMDFRSRYRLWQLAWADMPTNQAMFSRTFTDYITNMLSLSIMVKRRLIHEEESDNDISFQQDTDDSRAHDAVETTGRSSKRSRRGSTTATHHITEHEGGSEGEDGVDVGGRLSDNDEQVSDYDMPAEITEEDRQRWAAENEAQIAYSRSQRGRPGATAERGVIDYIEVFDFMCHRHLKVTLGPKINFIIGHNGSGKSAILTAIMVCLGGKANATNRAQNLKALIREGASMAEVRLQLRNEGEDAFKPEVYGSRILIERRIAKDGSSGYKLKSVKGKTISTKRDELAAMCDHMNIQVDNPMNVLGQDAARQFLHTSSEHDKYTFFSRGTQLSQLSADYELIRQCIDTMQTTLKDKRDLLPELYELAKAAEARFRDMKEAASLELKLQGLQQQYAWAQIEAIEKEVAELEEKLREQIDKGTKIEKKREETQADVAEFDRKIEQAEADLKNQQSDLTPTIEKRRALEQQLRDKRNELKACQDEETNANNEIKNIRNHLRKLDDQIAKEKQRLESNTAAKRAEIENKIQEAVEKSDRMRLDLATAKEEVAKAENEIRELTSKRDRIQEILDRDRREREELRRQIQEMRGQKENAMRAFGRAIPEVLADIESVTRRGGFKGPVVGPVGRYIKLDSKSQEWAPVIESALGATLNAFVVENYDDRKILEDIFRKRDCQSEIIKTKREIFAYREPAPHFDTICRVLQFEDEWMRRILIDRHAIEQTILMRDRAEADRVTSSGPNGGMPENVAMCLTVNLIRVGDQSGAASSIQMRRYTGPPRLAQDVDHLIVTKDNEARAKEDSIRFRIGEMQRLVADIDRFDDARLSHKRKMVFLERDLKNVTRVIESLQQSLQEDDTSNLPVFEEERAKALEEIETLKRQYEPVAQQKQKIMDEMEPIKREILELNDVLQQHDDATRKLRGVVEKLNMEKQDVLRKVQHWENRLDANSQIVKEKEAELVERQQYLAKSEAEARQYCDRVPVQSSVPKLEREIKQIQERLKQEAAQRGCTVEEITRDMVRKKDDYKAAKVAIHQLDRFVEHLKVTLHQRLARWREFRQHAAARSISNFRLLLSTRGYTGDLDFQHSEKRLVVRVETEDQRTAKTGVSRDKDPKSLSGGEKSFSTICLLLSMWDSMSATIRCLDEFDVFMDAVNRRISMRMLIETARESDGVQYILITPQDASSVSPGPDIRVHRLHDPERNQAVLQ